MLLCSQTVAKRMDGEGQSRMFGEPRNHRQARSNMPRRTRVDGSGPRSERIPKQRFVVRIPFPFPDFPRVREGLPTGVRGEWQSVATKTTRREASPQAAMSPLPASLVERSYPPLYFRASSQTRPEDAAARIMPSLRSCVATQRMSYCQVKKRSPEFSNSPL